MKPYKYVAYVFAGEHVWRASTNSKQRAKEFAREKGGDSYALLYKYELRRTEDVPAVYIRARDGWCKTFHWSRAIPKEFKEGDGDNLSIHRRMEEVAVNVEV